MKDNNTQENNALECNCRAEEVISKNHEFKLSPEDIAVIAQHTKQALARTARK